MACEHPSENFNHFYLTHTLIKVIFLSIKIHFNQKWNSFFSRFLIKLKTADFCAIHLRINQIKINAKIHLGINFLNKSSASHENQIHFEIFPFSNKKIIQNWINFYHICVMFELTFNFRKQFYLRNWLIKYEILRCK